VFAKLRGWFHDKTCEQLCGILQANGVSATLGPNGSPEEKIISPLLGLSLGMIEIADSPVRWICLKHQISEYDERWYVEYGVPDARITFTFPRVNLRAEPSRGRQKVAGNYSDLRWSTERPLPRLSAFEKMLISRIEGDAGTKEAMLATIKIGITSHGHEGVWLLYETKYDTPLSISFSAFEKVARHLLTLDLDVSPSKMPAESRTSDVM
jgi:hypothetical protein